MSNRILLIAHAPLAHALAACAAHVFPDAGERLLALDVAPSADPVASLQEAEALLLKRFGAVTLATLSNDFHRRMAQHKAQGLAGHHHLQEHTHENH